MSLDEQFPGGLDLSAVGRIQRRLMRDDADNINAAAAAPIAQHTITVYGLSVIPVGEDGAMQLTIVQPNREQILLPMAERTARALLSELQEELAGVDQAREGGGQDNGAAG